LIADRHARYNVGSQNRGLETRVRQIPNVAEAKDGDGNG
jgi:hypothetical protein